MSPGLLKVAERAKENRQFRFNSLAHLIDEAALERAYRRLRKDAAKGVDGVTVEQYGQALADNLRELHRRMKAMQYRHQPIRRVHIPKENGKTRPIGVSTVEDKVVQGALREVLEAIYEQDFMPCSYGFRPGRSAHDAIRELNLVVGRGEVSWVLEADIMSFFDSVDRSALKEMLQRRVADGSMMRLIGKCLHVGVLDGEEYAEPGTGTAQGSILSPLLGNIYLHNVLDVWFEEEVKPRLAGKATLIRYADDFIIAFDREDDARRVMAVIGQRMKKYGLTLHPEKTRLLPFGRPSKTQTSGKAPATFDFLGFTHYWRRSRAGRWYMACRTRGARLRRAIQTAYEWCRSHRHEPLIEQHLALTRRLNGHMNYFGVNGNWLMLAKLVNRVRAGWHKWLNRRSQRARLNWKRFEAILRRFPLPRPRIKVQLWARTESP
jgi:group II intron reverse transcriptase/maturase